MEESFALFFETVDDRYKEFVKQVHDLLMTKGYKCNISPSKTGYLVSYVLKNRTLASFVSRKTGMKLRIYPEHVNEYQSFLDTMPNNIKKDIKKASVCKRLLNPDDCNPKCQKGYTFDMDEEHFVKCRFMAFMPSLSEENDPYIMEFLEKELALLFK